ncbi:alpha/beta hydrolase-fold protein, partial [Nitrosomonas nitrosa]|uniref:alpha/beta hydrolase-fold protein n=1 Tax=Nitrosomonas nitrosa TaxID=52442 RepID=UPI0023F6A420
CPWGQKAFQHFLGNLPQSWREHDATALIEAGYQLPALLVDQGLDDPFLSEQLHLDRFEAACQLKGQPLNLRRHEGYDHGYYFISTFIADHLHHHYNQLA